MQGDRRMAAKAGRQNRHQRRLRIKIKRFIKREWKTEGLEKALRIATGEEVHTSFKTGTAADARIKKIRS